MFKPQPDDERIVAALKRYRPLPIIPGNWRYELSCLPKDEKPSSLRLDLLSLEDLKTLLDELSRQAEVLTEESSELTLDSIATMQLHLEVSTAYREKKAAIEREEIQRLQVQKITQILGKPFEGLQNGDGI